MDRRKFIKTAGSGAIVISSPGILFSGTANQNCNADEELLSRSISAFRRFEEVWDFNDFWKRGNTFDACLNFADAAYSRWPGEVSVRAMHMAIRDMLAKNLEFFKLYDPGGLWADDFGWWGLMALNARKHLLRLGDKAMAMEYLKLSTDLCWEYKKNTAYDNSQDAKPVPHGCRNGDANGSSRGVKNTVTNVLLFLLSSRIYRLALEEDLPDKDKYLEMAFNQWIWFDTWFQLDEYNYLKEIKGSGAMVQERPMAIFAGSDYTEIIHPPWAEGWVWTGDQGMLLAALTDMLAVKNEIAEWAKRTGVNNDFDIELFDRKNRSYIKLIGKGIKKALIWNKDKIFREAPCFSSFGPVHGRDYVAGRGIMMRYLGKVEIKNLLGVKLDENIIATAEAVWQTRDQSNNQFQAEFTAPENDHQYINEFRKLWGTADDVVKWNLDIMQEKNKLGVCQAVGLDALGAAIKTYN